MCGKSLLPSAGCGKLGAESWVRKAGCGKLGAESWVRKAGCGKLGAETGRLGACTQNAQLLQSLQS